MFSPSSDNSFARASLTGDTTNRLYERATAKTSVKYSQKSSPIKNAILEGDPLSILEEEKSIADSTPFTQKRRQLLSGDLNKNFETIQVYRRWTMIRCRKEDS